MKKFLLSILLVCMLGCIAEAKEGEITMTGQIVMKINNSKAFVSTLETVIDYNDNSITPIVDNGIVFIPVRFVAQHSGCRVEWIQENNTLVIIDKENNTIQISINSNVAIIQGRSITLKYQPKLINNRTYMEINDLASLLECSAVIENDFIVLNEKTNNIPDTIELEKMYYEHPTTHGDLYPIYKFVSNTEYGAVGFIGFMDKNGMEVIEPNHQIVDARTTVRANHYFSQGLYCTSREIINEKNEILYTIPKNGKAYPPKDGIIGIMMDYPLSKTDTSLPIYLDIQFKDITALVKGKNFNSGLNIFEKDGFLYAENKSGNIVIEFPEWVKGASVVTAPVTNYSNVRSPQSYILFVQMGKAGIMNLDGTILFEPKYDRIKILADDVFAVYENENPIPKVLDSAGNSVFPFDHMEVVGVYKDLAIVCANAKQGVLHKNYAVILEPIYEDIKINNGLILAKEGNKFKVFSNEGALLLNTDYTDMDFVYDLIYFKNDKSCGYMDYQFNIIYEW